ncbi:AP2 domain-containing protein [bacterium]|nr:AP2 domain-containing protein [bacterium]
MVNQIRRSLVFGIGINDSDYVTNPRIDGKLVMCPYYSTWVEMLARCYSEKRLSKKPTYIGCTVSKEWHSFMVFRTWMMKQDWAGKVLDKDVLVVGNKVYSAQTCVFVTVSVNGLLTHIRSSKGEYPVGVNFNDSCINKFISRCYVDGKRKHLGRFATPEEAGEVYKIAKSNEITRVASLQTDPRIYQGLINHAEAVLNE